jgi:hypothetical protein
MFARTPRTVFRLLVPTLAGLLAASTTAGCASEEEDIEDGSQDVVGGTSKVESPVVYLFDGTNRGTPTCSGALLGSRVAVTAKACAKTGMTIARAADRNGQGKRARVTQVEIPDGLDADIAVVAFDASIGGPHAVITHAPLKDGYSVNSRASSPSTTGREDTVEGPTQAASIRARMVSETDAHGEILPASGSQICNSDLGAPVCSSIQASSLFGTKVTGTCGLAGLVVGPSDAPAPTTTAPPPGSTAAPQLEGRACSSNAWKVAQLGRYAEFLRRFAPDAFEPIKVEGLFGNSNTVVPADLWAFRSNGTVRACKIETPTLAPVPVGGEARLTARVSFSNLQERAAPWGRFGIALKSAPTKVRWLPATPSNERTGTSFETSFSGAVSANVDGEYVVMFRASANGGETWTTCDTDGMENNFSLEKALALKVGTGVAGTPATTTPGTAPATPTDPSPASDAPSPTPAADSSSSSDGTSDETTPEGDESAAADKDKKKKTKKEGGCSAAPVGTGSSRYAPVLGLLLGLGVLGRRRIRRS